MIKIKAGTFTPRTHCSIHMQGILFRESNEKVINSRKELEVRGGGLSNKNSLLNKVGISIIHQFLRPF